MARGRDCPAFQGGLATGQCHSARELLEGFGFMKIEEAILYVLAERGGGLKTEQIAEVINRRRLHIRKDGQPVTSAQVYAVVMRYPDTFVKAEGRIMLMI